MNPYLALGVTPREALLLELLGRFEVCFASMSWIARQLEVSVRHAFRLQAKLRADGHLVSDRQFPGSNRLPPGAQRPERLHRMQWAIRGLSGAAQVVSLAKRAKIEAWRAEREAKRTKKAQEAARKREARAAERAQRQADANPPPPPAPYTREFQTVPPTGPVSEVPAAAWAVLGRAPPK